METKNQEKEKSLKKEEQLNEKVSLSDEQLAEVTGGTPSNVLCARECEKIAEKSKCLKECMKRRKA